MKNSLLFLFLLSTVIVYGQSLEKSDSIVFRDDITCLCVNIKGEIFFGLNSGGIVKTSKSGQELERFSYPNIGSPTHIDCANSLKVFVYFDNTQSYLFIDRFTVNPTIYSISENPSERVDFATLVADQSIWYVTSPSLTLFRKSQDQTTSLYLLSSLFTEGVKATTLFSVGNTVILQTEKKAFLFNLAGQLIKDIELKTAPRLSVAANEAYYISNQMLFTLSTDKSIDNKFPKGYSRGVLLSSNEYLLIKNNKADFYFMR